MLYVCVCKIFVVVLYIIYMRHGHVTGRTLSFSNKKNTNGRDEEEMKDCK